MENTEKRARKEPRKPPPSAIRLMPTSLASLFIAASVGRLSHLFPRWMSAKIEKVHDVTSSQILAIFIISQEEQVTMGQLSFEAQPDIPWLRAIVVVAQIDPEIF